MRKCLIVGTSANCSAKAFQCGFRTFSEGKKCEGHPAGGCERAPAHQLIRAERSSNAGRRIARTSSSTMLAACGCAATLANGSCSMPTPTSSKTSRGEGLGAVGYGTDGSMDFVENDMGCGWLLPARVVLAGALFLLAYTLTQWQAEQSLVVAELGCRRHTSLYGGFQKNLTFFAAFLRCSHLEVWCVLSFSSYLAVTSYVWVLPVEYRVLDSCGDCFFGYLLEEFRTFSLARLDSDPEASWSPCSSRVEKCAQSMLQFSVIFALLALGKLNTLRTSLAVCVMMDGIFAAC